MRPDLRPADQPFEWVTVRNWHQRHLVGGLPRSKSSAIAAPTVSMGRCCCDLTLPLTPTGTGRGGRRARRCCCDVALPLTPTGAGRGMPLTSTGTGRGTNAGLWDAWKDILHHR